MRWPLGDRERRTLTEMGDPALIAEGNKHYVLRYRDQDAADLGYDAHLPLQIPSADAAARYTVPFNISDDIDGARGRIREVRLRIRVFGLVGADRLTVLLNGDSLSAETCLRDYGGYVRNPPSPHINEHYSAQWLEFELNGVRPRKGLNELAISLDGRPEGLVGGVTVEDVEVLVEYGPYPSALDTSARTWTAVPRDANESVLHS